MDRHELNRMFDGLEPDPQRERELLCQLLQDDARRKTPMKNWKRAVVGVAAAALLVTAATAAVVPGISQKLLDYLGVAPEDTQVTELLAPGAMAVDITKEDNGATLHVTQVLRDRTSIMVLVDFTAPEGTSLRLGSTNSKIISSDQGFYGAPGEFVFLDEAGKQIDGVSYAGEWKILEDDDPMDNRLSALFVTSHDGIPMEQADAMRIPATMLGYSDLDENGNLIRIEVYSGDWSFEVPLPQKDIGYALRLDQPIGELDGDVIMLEEIYLSPISLETILTREGGDEDFFLPAYGVTLTTADGHAITMDFGSGGFGGYNRLNMIFSLPEVTNPARFQGGMLTLDWSTGTVTIPLNDLTPVEP